MAEMVEDNSEIERWLAGKSKNTRTAYRRALRHFAVWLAGDWQRGLAVLERLRSQDSWRVPLREYSKSLTVSRMSKSTRAIRLTAVRRFVTRDSQASVHLVVPPAGLESGVNVSVRKSHVYQALTEAETHEMVEATEDPRDRAIVFLISRLGWKRGQVASLDFDGERPTSDLLRAWITQWPAGGRTLTRALERWLDERGRRAGPLFTSRGRGTEGNRLTGASIARIVGLAGDRIGRGHISPEVLRRAAESFEPPVDGYNDKMRRLLGLPTYDEVIQRTQAERPTW